MFTRWGAFVYRFRKAVLVLTAALAIGSLGLAAGASSQLSSGGWLDPNSESSRVSDRLSEVFGAGKSSLIVLFRSTRQPGEPARFHDTRVHHRG